MQFCESGVISLSSWNILKLADECVLNNGVEIDVWAMRYETLVGGDEKKSLREATIKDIHSGATLKTGRDGYARIKADVGQKITLMFNKTGFPCVQSATVIVPEEGLKGFEKEITFQAPGLWLYEMIKSAIGRPQAHSSHIVTTIQPPGHHMHNDKGMPGVRVFLKSVDGQSEREADLYLGQSFGLISDWTRPLLAHRFAKISKSLHHQFNTNSFLKNVAGKLDQFAGKLRHYGTSKDGAAMFIDIPHGEYFLEARKDGYEFSKTLVDILPESPLLINVSPPQSPRVINSSVMKKAPVIS